MASPLVVVHSCRPIKEAVRGVVECDVGAPRVFAQASRPTTDKVRRL
jgi:hypothetical protein